MPRGDRFHEWDFEKTAKKKGVNRTGFAGDQ